MRVSFACVPQTGHVAPLLDLAEALAHQGDDVLVATSPDAGAAVAERGLALEEVGPPFGDWMGQLVGRTRGAPGDGLAPERVERYFLPRLFGEIGTALVADPLLDVVRRHRSDLIVHDPCLFAAPLVAAVTGTPSAHHAIGPLYAPEITDLVADAVSPIWRQFGLEVPPHAGIYEGMTLTVCPRSLDPAASELAGARPLRPSPPPAAGPPPALGPPGLWRRPVIYVTMGTFSNSNVENFRLLLGAVAELPVNVVATVGHGQPPDAFTGLARNVHVASFIPQGELLPHCTAVVHHAGAGTTFGVLAHGLPSLAVPQSADNFSIGRRLAAAGAARLLMPGEVTGRAVTEELEALLAEGAAAASARRLAEEIAAMPPPETVAAELRRLIASRAG